MIGWMRAAVVVAVFASGVATAQNAGEATPPSATSSTAGLLEIKDRLLYMHGNGWGGGLHQGGKKVDIGFLGSNFDDIFGEFPEALNVARTSQTLMLVGVSIYAVGVTLLAVDLVLILLEGQNWAAGGSIPALWWAGLAVGGVLGIAGGLMMSIGGLKFLEAVNRYNFSLINKQLPQDKKFDIGQMLSRRQRTVPLLTLTF